MIFLVYVEHGLKQLSIDMLSIKLNTQYLKSRLISLLFKKLCDQVTKLYISGALIQIWTGDLSLTKGVLYHWAIRANLCFNGAGDEGRTRDMQLGRLPLYQLSYSRTMSVQTVFWSLKLVVGEGFEPSKLTRQSYSLFPLAARESHLTLTFSAVLLLHFWNTRKWCRHQESNSGPTDYKSVALPTELCRRFPMFRTFVSERCAV